MFDVLNDLLLKVLQPVPDEFRSVYGVAEGLIGNLDGQISQQPLLGLNGIPFIVIIGEVEQLEAE